MKTYVFHLRNLTLSTYVFVLKVVLSAQYKLTRKLTSKYLIFCVYTGIDILPHVYTGIDILREGICHI